MTTITRHTTDTRGSTILKGIELHHEGRIAAWVFPYAGAWIAKTYATDADTEDAYRAAETLADALDLARGSALTGAARRAEGAPA